MGTSIVLGERGNEEFIHNNVERRISVFDDSEIIDWNNYEHESQLDV
jgi:hypothetical protein